MWLRNNLFDPILLPDGRQQVGLTKSPLSTLNSSQDTQGCGSAWPQIGAQPMLGMATVKTYWKQSQEPFVESESWL